MNSQISLRDYFAAAALQGSLACPGLDGDPTSFARYAWRYADVMLAERGKRERQQNYKETKS